VLLGQLELDRILGESLSGGREQIPWPLMAMVLVLGRLCNPSSELQWAERFYEHSALPELLGVPAEKVNEDRLYRALDALLPHKLALEKHLRQKLGEFFALDYDLLLYDVTSTYFEGEGKINPLAQRGYSRDHRPDCKQVNIALVESRSGMPVGYEVFAGNRHDATTLEEMIEHIEKLHGRAQRIWVLDRGMVSEENVEFLKQGHRRYIVGTPKSMLKRYERELLTADWRPVHAGLEVRLCPAPDGAEVFILCRSGPRQQKEQAMHARFEKRIEEGLLKIETACTKRKQNPLLIAQRVGRLLGKNTRAAGLFQVQVQADSNGFTRFRWSKSEPWRDWARLSEGCGCAVTSSIGPRKNCGGPISNSPKPRTPSAFRNQICRFARYGTRSKSECRLISWSAFWPTCSGKHWRHSAAKPSWETNRGKSSASCPRLPWSMSCCQHATESVVSNILCKRRFWFGFGIFRSRRRGCANVGSVLCFAHLHSLIASRNPASESSIELSGVEVF
jgi:hypothetical protein